MALNDTIKRIHAETADIGSKMMTGKTIEERVKEIFVKASDKNEAEYIACKECTMWEDCENKESRDGCYFGEKEAGLIKLWIDDVRPAPKDYDYWITSVAVARDMIEDCERKNIIIDLIDIDHDGGAYAIMGGDYIKLLDWLEETGRNYPIRIHSMNPVGVANMRRIIERNGWKEVF